MTSPRLQTISNSVDPAQRHLAAVQPVSELRYLVQEQRNAGTMIVRAWTGSRINDDEWTVASAMAADTGSGGGLEAQMRQHYETFITEQDIADIAGAGLNWVRLPIPFWAIDTWQGDTQGSAGEPFLKRKSWNYVLKAFAWARKYGLRICLDLHTVPGTSDSFLLG